jgi:bacterioferritin
MKGNDEVVRVLNRVLYNELIAINQYFLHSRMFRNWGITKLAEYEYKESLDEMRHADELIERILFLDGLPNLQDLGKLLIGEDIEEALRCDLKLEVSSLPTLREGIALCEKHADFNSRQLLTKILHGEEEHIDFLEAQFELIKRMGLQNYVQLQSGAAED